MTGTPVIEEGYCWIIDQEMLHGAYSEVVPCVMRPQAGQSSGLRAFLLG